MKNKIISLSVLAVALLVGIVALIGVFSMTGNGVKENSETIQIGAVLPLSGPAASVGETLRQGLEWKISELNSEGYNIELIIEDFQSDPKQAVTAFNKLTEIENTPIVYTIVSSSGMSLKPLAEEKKVLLWADISHEDFTKNSNYLLRHSNIAESDGKILAKKILEKNPKKVGIIYQNDDWGNAMKNSVKENLEKSNVQVYFESVELSQTDFKTQINKIESKDIDAFVFMIIGNGAGIVVKQTKELGFKGDVYSSIGLILTPSAVEVAGDSLKGTYFQTFEGNEKFAQDYEAKFGKKSALMGYIGYTDMEILISAIEKTDSTDPLTLVNYIKNLGSFQGKYEKVSITNQGDIILDTAVKAWS